MVQTNDLIDLFKTIVYTFNDIYSFFNTDIGKEFGVSILNGVSVFEAMFGASITIFMTATLIKWVIGIVK